MSAATMPAVWILHGQPDTSATWQPTRRALLAQLHTPGGPVPEVRVLDRPGYGRNPGPARDYAGNVAWLQGELDRSGIERVVLLGHSWAGGVAVLTAVADPRVTGLVLAASVGPHCLIPQDQLLAARGVGEVLAWSGLSAGRQLVRRAVRRRLAPALHPSDLPHARTAGFGDLNRPVWRSFLVEQRSLLRDLTRIEAALPEIDVPTLVVAGRRDRVIPETTIAALTARIHLATRIDVDSRHELNLDAPTQLAGAIAAWLLARSSGS